MATIATTLTLRDRVSNKFHNIAESARQATNKIRGIGAAARATGAGYSAPVAGQKRLNNLIRQGQKEASGLVKELGAIGAAYAAFQTLKASMSAFVQMSDALASSDARLANIVDSSTTLEAVTQGVFNAAQNARGSYESMAQFVARVGNMSGDLFSSNQELIKFSETLNKSMTLNGTTTWEAEAAMTQLSQALASGVLRGEELNSVFEQAPGIIRMISDYMGVDIGQIRAMASEGQITAEIVKNAVLAGAADIDAAFEKMPYTWAQIWQSFKNQAMFAMKPVSELWSQLINSDEFQAMMQSAVVLLTIFVQALAGGITKAVELFQWLSQFTLVRVIFASLATLIGVRLTLAMLNLGRMGIVALGKLIVGALGLATSFAMAHMPLLIIIGLFALIVQGCLDMGMSVREVFTGLLGTITGTAYAGVATFDVLWEGIKVGAHNAGEFIKEKLADALDWVASKINNSKLAQKIGISADRVSYSANYRSYDAKGAIQEAFDKGYAQGSYLANKGMNWLKDVKNKVTNTVQKGQSLVSGNQIPKYEDLVPSAAKGDEGAGNPADSLADIDDYTKETAENTKKLADTLKAMGFDLAMLKATHMENAMRKIEQNVKLNIDMPVTNAADVDLDGFVNNFVDKIQTELENTSPIIAGTGAKIYG